MKKARTKHSAVFKAKVVLEVIQQREPVAVIARRRG
jgi:hypothetical protein